MKTGSHSNRSERTTGEPETAETAARQPDGSAASPATRSRRQIDGSALTSNRKTVPDFFGRLYPNDLVNGSFLGTWVRRAEVDALLDEIERLRAAMERITECVEYRDGSEGVQVIAGSGHHFWSAIREAKRITHGHISGDSSAPHDALRTDDDPLKPPVEGPSQVETSTDARDAARYRFLRQPGNAIVYAKDRNAWGQNASGHVRYDTPEQLDAAIDAALGSVVETGRNDAGVPQKLPEGVLGTLGDARASGVVEGRTNNPDVAGSSPASSSSQKASAPLWVTITVQCAHCGAFASSPESCEHTIGCPTLQVKAGVNPDCVCGHGKSQHGPSAHFNSFPMMCKSDNCRCTDFTLSES